MKLFHCGFLSTGKEEEIPIACDCGNSQATSIFYFWKGEANNWLDRIISTQRSV